MPDNQEVQAPTNPLERGGAIITEKPAEQADAKAPEVAEMPKGGDEKFYNAENGEYDWQGHAQHLLDEQEQKAQEAPKAEAPKAEEAPDQDAAKQAVANAGLDWQELEAELGGNGLAFKPETRQKIIDAGIPADVVDMHVEMMQHYAASHQRNIHEAFGGKDEYEQAMADFSSKADPHEKSMIAEMLSDPGRYQLAARMLQNQAGAAKPHLRGERPEPAQEAKPYASQEELDRAIASDRQRYRKDPDYRAQIEARAAASSYVYNPRVHTPR